jgi:hypothetical protein
MTAQDAQNSPEVQAIKARFTPEEWETLVSGPGWMVARIILAAPSGLIGLVQELNAATTALRPLLEQGSPSPLVNAVAAELKGKKDETKKIEAATKDSNSSEEAAAKLEEQIRAVNAILTAKAAPEDAAAYRAFVLDLGRKVADAAKEGGGVFGGGTSLSPQEQAALQRMEAVLGGGDRGRGAAA